jgi:hypothetical protein
MEKHERSKGGLRERGNMGLARTYLALLWPFSLCFGELPCVSTQGVWSLSILVISLQMFDFAETFAV